ncbi:MAG: D-2-hydroxyacid dehydrogenase, partial [Gemmatimonadota bacterium]|nr:D-2-hydroxyacid dehydrogenase [Gemmatimonadota bacterium]
AVARRSAVLGTRVLALRRGDAEPPAGLELLRGPDALPRLLAASDALVIALPETEATRGMIGAAQLALLRPGAVLVNVGRGAVVDEAALAEALRSGGLRGAALDVFAREPLPADSPLWTLSNVLVLPHVSGTSARFWRRQTDLLVDNLRRFLSGRPLRNVVRKDAGY